MRDLVIIIIALFAAWLVAIGFRHRGASAAIVGALTGLVLLANIVAFVWNVALARAAEVGGQGGAGAIRALAFPGWWGGLSLLVLVVLWALLLLPAAIPLRGGR